MLRPEHRDHLVPVEQIEEIIRIDIDPRACRRRGLTNRTAGPRRWPARAAGGAGPRGSLHDFDALSGATTAACCSAHCNPSLDARKLVLRRRCVARACLPQRGGIGRTRRREHQGPVDLGAFEVGHNGVHEPGDLPSPSDSYSVRVGCYPSVADGTAVAGM